MLTVSLEIVFVRFLIGLPVVAMYLYFYYAASAVVPCWHNIILGISVLA